MRFIRWTRRTVPTALPILAALAALAFGTPAYAGFCIGVDCGLTELGPSAHCHSQNEQGEECWDEVDNACEDVPGFSTGPGGGGVACGLVAPGGEIAGAGGQQSLVLSGYSQFRSQIVKPATARKAEEDAQAAQEAEEGDDEDEGADYAVHLSEISTALEYEDWELAGQQGETVGARFDWLRETETGMLWGASASYQEASPDRGESTELLNGQLSVGHTFGMGGMDWSWAAFGTVSDISGPVSDTLFGAGGRVAFSRYFDGGRVLSGGALGQFQTADELDDDLINVGAGAAYGFPVAERFALDFELYAVNIIEPEVVDDTFYTGAGMFSVYFSPRFTLTLGARVLEGIDQLDSITYTVGGSTRFW